MIQPPACRCYWCANGKAHPVRHTDYYPVSGHQTVAESLDPSTVIPQEACSTCGHVRQSEPTE